MKMTTARALTGMTTCGFYSIVILVFRCSTPSSIDPCVDVLLSRVFAINTGEMVNKTFTGESVKDCSFASSVRSV
jgi:hypothetical protein